MRWPSIPSTTVRHRLAAAVLALLAVQGNASAADGAGWPIVGRQGIVALVLVPDAQATDQPAYEREIDRLCKAGETCFLNFYTNTKRVPVTVPLPDSISNEATATFRRSTKQGAQMFMWSCRMKVSSGECF